MKALRLELHYLPCLEYFSCLMQHESIVLEYQENYLKQTYRNRCYVKTSNKIDLLTIPVLKGTQKSRDIRIDYSQDWVRRHWGCFQSSYGKSPFFEFYAPELELAYRKKPVFLFDLNFDLLTICLRFLGVKKVLSANLSYEEINREDVFDKRMAFNNKKTVFDEVEYKIPPYYQTFGNDFVPNLSIVDLLFNAGPESRKLLIQPQMRPN